VTGSGWDAVLEGNGDLTFLAARTLHVWPEAENLPSHAEAYRLAASCNVQFDFQLANNLESLLPGTVMTVLFTGHADKCGQ
jgi:hypothetical protein